MIHVTFSNGETALFEANERIWVYEFIVHGEYIIGDKHIHGFDLLNPKLVGWYILQGDNEDMFVMVDSPIKSVRRL